MVCNFPNWSSLPIGGAYHLKQSLNVTWSDCDTHFFGYVDSPIFTVYIFGGDIMHRQRGERDLVGREDIGWIKERTLRSTIITTIYCLRCRGQRSPNYPTQRPMQKKLSVDMKFTDSGSQVLLEDRVARIRTIRAPKTLGSNTNLSARERGWMIWSASIWVNYSFNDFVRLTYQLKSNHSMLIFVFRTELISLRSSQTDIFQKLFSCRYWYIHL